MFKPQVTTGNLCCAEVSREKEEEWNSMGPGNCSTALRETWHEGFGLWQQPLPIVSLSEPILK